MEVFLMQARDSKLASCPTRCIPDVEFELRHGERWYVVQTHAQREYFAQLQLRNQAFRTFLPLYEKTVRHAQKTVQKKAPLFPGYLFMVLNVDLDRWHAVNSTFGVSRLVTAGDRPLPVPRGVIETLISMSSSDRAIMFHPVLEPGQKVRLQSGPFAEQLGILQHLDDRGRVAVLLEMMGAWHTIHVSRGIIFPSS